MKRFLELCLKEQNLPRCIDPTCQSLYLRGECSSSLYDITLLKGLLKARPLLEESSVLEATRKRMWDQIVEERRIFLQANFPVSIQRAVDILYSKELKKIHKENREALETQAQKIKSKRCFRLFCGGVMLEKNQVWKCENCDSQYCWKCETRYEAGHQCSTKEIASVEWKRALPHCPKCDQPIEKLDGCDNMTCAVCRQNFSYVTGQVTQAGNHGKSKPVTLSKESLTSLWNILLKGREVEHLSMKEIKLVREWKRLEELWEENKIKSTQEPNWEWKPMDISSFAQYIKKNNTFDTEEEKRVAKMIAKRVEKLEIKRQSIRYLMTRLRTLEDAILSV